MHNIVPIIILLVCSLVALVTLYLAAVKSNKILFYDKSDNLKGKFYLVSAGSIDKNKEAANICLLGKITEDIDKYEKLLVDGNSMKKFGIGSGDIVLVDKDYKKEDLSVEDNSIIVFTIRPQKGRKIKYKLRKFIDFYDFSEEPDFNQWLAKNHSSLKTDREAWLDKETGKDKRDDIKKYGNERLVLSETSIKKSRWHLQRKVHYSIHPESRIEGKVQYKIPREKVYILNKV